MSLSHSTKGQPLSLPGAVSATRYVGATASVAPVAGTFVVGDFIVTSAGGIFVCTVAGTSGTWVAVGGGGGISQISGSGAGAIFFGPTTVEIDSPDASTSLQVANGNVLLFGAGTPGALSGKGVQIAAGADLIGIWISERTSAVLQMYADGAGTQDIELVDQSTGHWKHVSAAGDASIPALGILRKLAAAPGSPVEGESYYDTVLHEERVWNGSAWAAGASLGILAVKRYAPGGGASYSTTSATFVAIDTTNLAVTFTAPPSGNVILSCSALVDVSASGDQYVWQPYIHAGAAVADPVFLGIVSSYYPTAYATFYVTGLTPGASVTLDWYWHTQSAGTPTIHLYCGGTNGAALMIVQAA
jgi:hypothetical protein